MVPIRIESLEDRRLFAFDNWGATARLIQQPDAIDAFSASSTPATGFGQTIAVIDSGIDYTNPLLGGALGPGHKVVGGFDFVDNDNDPMDTFGHGTEVAGMLAASQFTLGGQTYQGIAPNAQLVALRIDGSTPGHETSVPDSRIEAALQWVIDHRDTYHINVVNISYGTGDFNVNVRSTVYGNEIQTLADEGVTIVAAAGNLSGAEVNDGGINTPAADPNVISVGSVDANDQVAADSRRGKILGLFAPGVEVATTLMSPDGGTTPGGTGVVSGTSFASPTVAGTVALMYAMDGTMVEHDALSILRASGKKVFDGGSAADGATRINYARLDVLTALKLTQARTPADSADQANIGQFGNGNATAVDAEGITHFVYYDSLARTMEYATRNSAGQWSATQEIDNSAPFQGYYVSMALDPQGQPAVAYFDGNAGDLKFARYDGISWNVQTLDSRNSVGLYPSLTFDRNGLAVISYYRKTSGDLKYAREQTDGTFRTGSVDTRGDVGRSTAISVDSVGRLGIAYEDTTHGFVKFAQLTTKATAWAATVADSKTRGVAFLSLAFSPADNSPWISYYDASPANLKVANFSNKSWHANDVVKKGAIGLFTTMMFVDEAATVVYWDKSNDALDLANLQDSTWNITTLKFNGGRYAAATIDPTLDIVRYSYYDTASRFLRIDADAVT